MNSSSDIGRQETSLSDDTRSDIEEFDCRPHDQSTELERIRAKSRLASITTLERESTVLQEGGAAMILSKSVSYCLIATFTDKANLLFIHHLFPVPFKGVRSQNGDFEETKWDVWFSNSSK